jgi:hypothetical protein
MRASKAGASRRRSSTVAARWAPAAGQQPARRGQAIVHRILQRRARHQPVVDRDHRDAAGFDQRGVLGVVEARVADHPAAAVDIEHDAAHRAGRAQHPHRHPQAVRLGHLLRQADAAPPHPAVGAHLRRAQQGLQQHRREAVADPEARQPGEDAVEAAHLVQGPVVERYCRHAQRPAVLRSRVLI